jgi:hypothetical protein
MEITLRPGDFFQKPAADFSASEREKHKLKYSRILPNKYHQIEVLKFSNMAQVLFLLCDI